MDNPRIRDERTGRRHSPTRKRPTGANLTCSTTLYPRISDLARFARQAMGEPQIEGTRVREEARE